MKPEAYKEWRGLSKAERERRVMERLLHGDVLRLHVKGSLVNGKEALLPPTTVEYLAEWVKKGLVKGAVPLLTDEGRKYFEGLENILAALPREALSSQPPASNTCPFCGEPEPHKKDVKCYVTKVHETCVGGQ